MATYNDTLNVNNSQTGTGFADTIYGNGGNDTLSGAGGVDAIYGGTGNDILDGGTAGDSLFGGGGDDRILLTGTFGADTIQGGETTDEVTGDTVDASALTAAISVVFSGAEAGSITSANTTATFSQIEGLVLAGLADSLNATLATSAVTADLGAGNDTAWGGSGADTLIGGGGADSILSGAGNDLVYDEAQNNTNAGAADYVDLGAGDDRYIGTGIGATDTDQIYGGTGNDQITALGGNDSLYGGSGNDTLTAGNDTLTSAGDQLYGGLGNDQLNGAGTADTLDGGDGADTLTGGAGNDILYGGDTLAGAGGTFILNGNFTAGTANWSGTDMEVNPESAYFTGGSTSNMTVEMDGNSGQTTVMEQSFTVAGTQAATLSFRAALRASPAGTAGVDGFTVTVVDANGAAILSQTVLPAAWANYTFNFTFPSGGTYTLRFTEVGNNDSIGSILDDVQITGSSVAYDAAGDVISGGDGDDTIYGYAGNDSLSGDAGNDSLIGGEGDDTLAGGDGADSVNAGGGNDRIILSSTDTIDGGAGLDTLDGTAGTTAEVVTFTSGTGGTTNIGTGFANIETFVSDQGADRYDASLATGPLTILTGADNDTVTGGAGNDTLDGGSGDDSLAGGAGADSITGGTGADTLAGGLGDDLLSGGDDADRFVIAATGGADQVFGGEGGTLDQDTLDLSALTTAVTAAWSGAEAGTATTSGGAVTFAGIERLTTGTGADTLNASGSPTGVWLDTGSGADVVTGSGAADTVAAGDGADSVLAGGGADVVDGGLGADTLSGEAGADSLTGGEGADALYGGTESDTLAGDAGNDLLYGGAGNDSLSGGTGDDSLLGEAGDDTLQGGTGSDGFVYLADGFGADAVTGGEDVGSAEIDYIYADLPGPVTVVYSGSEAGTMTAPGAGNGTVSFSQIEALWTGAGADLIDGRLNGAGGYVLTNDGADTIWGGAGVEQIYAGSGADSIDGGAGADQVFGGAGSDWIKGDSGDTVDGGAGDFDTLDLSAWGFARTNVIYSATDPQAGTVEFLNSDGTVQSTMTFSNIEKVMPCFTPGTLIQTGRGAVAVECLAPGDLILTRDNGVQPLRWIGRRALSLADLIVQPRLQPLRITAGSLGAGLPRRDLTVSPQHRMLIEGARAEMLFGEAEVLVAARHLEATPLLPAGVTYIHLLFDAHEIIQAEGAWTESFQPAARMLSEMEAETRAEIEALFPDLSHQGFPAARLSLKAHEAKVLLAA
ncbi:Hint domain-containing protein [Rhodobacter sp. KR11]|uniref:Hint domain-containing protein n=1 Tax=Rhodobacter sp. KR11 TaxID=2974588 RepID=UPI002221A939|nr:Hint domain-containing protein [Rhodobacter sp. KR11]MCW1917628.1 Hint domain-containing protein [Rhodobacter sp. KR11]